MYAIINHGGKQYKLEKDKDIVVDKIEGKEGDKVKFSEISMLSDGKTVKVGTPFVKSASVEATIKKQFKGDKVIAFKYKPKKRYRRKIGHRQQLTLLHPEKINAK